jgi:hypothetical protein
MNLVRARARRCTWRGIVVVAATSAATALAVLAPPAAADPAGVCPDSLVLLPATVVVQGDRKDHNQNGLVCAKVEDGRLVGGPDDVLDDIVL